MPAYSRLIKIGSSLYLTDTGLSTGDKLITEVGGLNKLRPANVGPIMLAASGLPRKFGLENTGAGILISISAARMPDDSGGMIDDIISINDTAEASDGLVRLTLTGANDDIVVDCVPGHPDGVECVQYPGGFIANLKIDVKLNYTVSAIIP